MEARDWTQLMPEGRLPEGRTGHSAVGIGEKMFLFGGRGGSSDLWFYDVQAAHWTELTPEGLSPEKRHGHSAICIGEKMFIFGGWSKGWRNDLWCYDVQVGCWTELTPEPPGPDGRSHHSAVSHGEKMFIFGGGDCWSGGGSDRNDLWCYDVKAGCWSETKNLSGVRPEPRSRHSAVCIRNELLIFGGSSSSTPRNDLWCHDLKANHWKELTPLGPSPRRRADHTGIAIGRKMFIFGGTSSDGADRNDLWCYDVQASHWSELLPSQPRYPERRSNHSAARIGERMLIFGGNRNDLWSYDAQAEQKRLNAELLQAASSCNVHKVQELLAARSDVTARDGGKTALNLAEDQGHGVLASVLKDAAAVKAEDDRMSLDAELLAEARDGCTTAVRRLLTARADLDTAGDDGKTPLQVAEDGNHHETVEELKNAVAKVEEQLRHNDELLCAIKSSASENGEKLLQLLQQRADVDAREPFGRRRSVLHLAVRKNRRVAARLLLYERADTESQSIHGETPLHKAICFGHRDIFQVLMAARANLRAQDNSGETAVHKASSNGRLEMLQALMQNGANVAATNKNGETALFGAAFNGRSAVVQLLLSAQAEAAASSNDGCTPLHGAALNGHEDVVQVLLDARADAAACTRDGRSALDVAEAHGQRVAALMNLEPVSGPYPLVPSTLVPSALLPSALL